MNSSFSNIKNNKFFQSAIGLSREVLMIIIGILLALKIDTYVSERAEKNSLRTNLLYVLEDISLNAQVTHNTKQFKEKSITACTVLLDNFKQEKPMESAELVATLSSILKTNKLHIDQSGFERIKTSPLYESDDFFEIRDLIREYNVILSDLRFDENFINAYISSLSLEMSKNGALLMVFDYVRMNQNIAQYKAEVPHFGVDEILADNKPLLAVLHKYEFDAPKLIQHYDQLGILEMELRKAIIDYRGD